MDGAARPPDSTDRQDLHNAAIDESAATAGRCATLDLSSGRICVLALRHAGSCLFMPRDMVRELRRS